MPRHRDRLRNWRLNRGLTQKELAWEWGVVHSFVSALERGARPIPPWVLTAIRRDSAKERSDALTGFGETMSRIMARRSYAVMQKHCPSRAETIRRLRTEGRTPREIAKEIGTSTQTVYNYLHNRRGPGKC